jgi:hypothetical protein
MQSARTTTTSPGQSSLITPESEISVRTFAKLTTSVAAAAAIGLTVGACTSSSTSTVPAASGSSSGCPTAAQNSNVIAPAGFKVCLFAGATATAYHPDSISVAGSDVFIGWQNTTAKDGTDTKTSTITQYTTAGKLVHSWSVTGHNDGLRFDPSTHLLWVMCDEDGNPRLYTIDPANGAASSVKQYTLPASAWGGGFDDIQFVNGMAVIDASNPTLNAAGKNIYPALFKVTLSGSKAVLTKVLMANAKASTISTPSSTVTLNLTDPDSMMIDPDGNLVLDSQGDSEMLWISGVGTAQQQVKVLSVGTQVDDTVFPSSAKGCLLVADNSSGVYSICSSVWVPGAAYTSAPNDSTVIGFVGTLNLSSGAIQPVIVGFTNPHGMAFIPQ